MIFNYKYMYIYSISMGESMVKYIKKVDKNISSLKRGNF